MKYANIVYSTRSNRITLGDDMQLLAIEKMYSQMGIDNDDIVRIDYGDLATYDGEYVILPISFPLLAYTNEDVITCFSERIIPVFLGVCMLADSFCDRDVAYMKRFAPIGCRDAYTLKNMKAHGIPAYLNGCMTLTLPLQENAGKGHKIICVDVPEHLRREIPESMLPDCEFLSHTYYVGEFDCTPEEKAREMYRYYINEARMVITTRLHAALPCMAAGIPVVFLKDEYSYRFAGVDAVVPFFSKDEYSAIDWNPEPVNFETHKKEVLGLAASRLKEAYEHHAPLCDLSQRLEEYDRKEYFVESIDNTKEYLHLHWDKQKPVEYVLWGVTQAAATIYSYIKRTYPNARLVGVVDRNKRIKFCGCSTCPKNEVEFDERTYFIVCAYAAIGDSNEWFANNGVVRCYQTGDDSYTHHKLDNDNEQKGIEK